MKTLNLEQFKKQTANDELSTWNSNEVQNAVKLSEEVNAFHPTELFFEFSEQDGKLYFEHPRVRIVHPFLSFVIRYDGYKKKYHIYCDSINNLRNIDHHNRGDLAKDMTEPVTIGVLSTKKVQAWITYYEQLYAALKALNEQHIDTIAAFRKSVEGLPIEWSKDKKQGWLKKGGLQYSFTLHDTGYVEQKITVDAYPYNLAAFLQMSENKFIHTEE